MAINAVTFDLETRKLASDLPGGWSDLRKGEGGVSCMVAWGSDRPHIYDHHTLGEGATLLENGDVVLSFNGKDFDIPVLEGVLGRGLRIRQHLDLLQLIWGAIPGGLRKGNKLTDVAQRTLGMEKNGDGLLAPKLADESRYGQLFDYCLQDVYLTRQLFIYAQQHGGVIGLDGQLLPLDLPEWYKEVTF